MHDPKCSPKISVKESSGRFLSPLRTDEGGLTKQCVREKHHKIRELTAGDKLAESGQHVIAGAHLYSEAPILNTTTTL